MIGQRTGWRAWVRLAVALVVLLTLVRHEPAPVPAFGGMPKDMAGHLSHHGDDPAPLVAKGCTMACCPCLPDAPPMQPVAGVEFYPVSPQPPVLLGRTPDPMDRPPRA